jgi:hypothetical protein
VLSGPDHDCGRLTGQPETDIRPNNRNLLVAAKFLCRTILRDWGRSPCLGGWWYLYEIADVLGGISAEQNEIGIQAGPRRVPGDGLPYFAAGTTASKRAASLPENGRLPSQTAALGTAALLQRGRNPIAITVFFSIRLATDTFFRCHQHLDRFLDHNDRTGYRHLFPAAFHIEADLFCPSLFSLIV